MTASVVYEGHLRCIATHNQSGTEIQTDAPTDNKGKGERFSPTDMVCVALGTCAITTMGIKGQDMGIDFAGTTIDIQKHMLSEPRRIGKIDVILRFPKSLNLSEKDRTIMERIGNTCPVAQSLSPALQANLVYEW
ncbi:OsmC family protein [Flavihumibacter fluvii]|jgi:putative redox protein|uniref:OsmC family protein n=1 Tax=Flavihumibacter fluvii TaxID=2838157 RepID=UPI001BDEFD06|nr:OsmC family protein [Flavihumibacter fluvii]ULQ53928.1 OsmC family protein [Flavihumibacter fluvii]